MCALVASIALSLARPAVAAAQPLDFSGVDEAARDAVGSGEIPGAVILVGRGDEILYERAFGWRAIVPHTETMTTNTIFDLASLTKPIGTTLAVMALVERGAVKLDAPLGRYLKEFRGAEFKQVTIRRLLTHSAGFAPTPKNASVKIGFPRAAREIAKTKLAYAPGTSFDYSDTGFILLAEMVRRVSGSRLDRYLERVVYRPLGLRDTMFRPSSRLEDRIAPTEWHDGHMMRGEVHDPRARFLGGVAGNAGLFSTANDVGRICRMLLRGGALGGRRIFRPETVRLMWTRSSEGLGTRALGWDVSSGYSLVMAPYFPAGSVGHTGYTGTSVWIDPPSQSYLIILTNRVHPNGGSAAKIKELRIRVAAAVGAALFAPPVLTASLPTHPASDAADEAGATSDSSGSRAGTGAVRSGLDVLEAQDFALLKGHRVGLITNQSGLDRAGRRGIDLIAAAPGVELRAIFSPEHGITGTVDENVSNSRDAATGVPIWSLYGVTRHLTAESLDGVDLLVFDLQEVGVRYYTYLATLVYAMEAAARHGITLVVLDRPDPITGRVVEGPLLDPDLESFTGIHPIPVRTGMTIGEFARMAAAERKIPVDLTVVPLSGWTRSLWYDETGLPWVNPSPNIRSVTQALLYSGIGLLETTNLSVGRGTSTPFEVVGAPWIDPDGVISVLSRYGLAGVRFDPVRFTPSGDRYAHVSLGGIRMTVTDRDAIRPVTIAFAIAAALREHHHDQFRPEAIQSLLASRNTLWTFLRGDPLDRVLAVAEMDRASFLSRRAPYLIYR